MTTNTALHVGFSGQNSGKNYWLKMAVVDRNNSVGKDEIARVIDRLYDIESCGDTGLVPDAEPSVELPFDETGFQEVVKAVFDPAFCLGSFDGSYTAQLKIWRSHQDEPYRLRLSNGTVGETVRVQEVVVESVVIDGDNTVTLSMPVVSNFIAVTPLEGLDNMSLDGSVVTFGQTVNGSASFSYMTEYDLVDIVVGGVDGKPADCMALAFYHGLVAEQQIFPPDGLSEDWIDLERYCGDPGGGVNVGDREDNITCYEVITYQNRCNCSNSVAWEDTAKVVVPCPESMTQCTLGFGSDAVWNSESQNYSCSSYLGSRTVLGSYVDCDIVLYDSYGNERGRKQEADDVYSSDYYLEECCVQPSHALPRCRETYRKNPGGKTVNQETRSALIAEWDGRVSFVGISPANNDCGTTRELISVASKTCCNLVPPLVWDEYDSADVIGDNSYGIVHVTGGKYPVTVSVRGDGFYLDAEHRIKDGLIYGSSFAIYTGDSCGNCVVKVTDGCSTVVGNVRSVNGEWGGDVYVYCLQSWYGEHYSYYAFTTRQVSGNECIDLFNFEYRNPSWLVYRPAGWAVYMWNAAASNWATVHLQDRIIDCAIGTPAGDWAYWFARRFLGLPNPALRYPNGVQDLIDSGDYYCGEVEWQC